MTAEIINLAERGKKYPIQIGNFPSFESFTNFVNKPTRSFTRQEFAPITDKIIPNLIKQYRAELNKEEFPLGGVGVYCLLIFDYKFCDEELIEHHINLSVHKTYAELFLANEGAGMADFIQMQFCNMRARIENISNVHFKFYPTMKDFFEAPSHFQLVK